MARLQGTASPLSQRSAVRLISVRRFASVCAPLCVCVWSCLAFSMQVTPSRACSRSPRPGSRQAGSRQQAGGRQAAGSRQAAGRRQADLPASEPSSPPASPSSPPRGCPALQQSAEFLSSLISGVLCVCVCGCPCTLCFLSLFPPLPHSLLCQMAKICLSIGSEAPAKTEGKNV